MRVQSRVTVYVGEPQTKMQISKDAKVQENGEKKAFFAGAFQGDLSLQERIVQRREQARKQAMKVVGDAWDGDRLIEKELNGSRERIRQLKQENREAQDNLREVEKQSEALKAEYGITDDCEEAKELELLRRRRAALRGEDKLSAEEWNESFEIEARGPSEYQQRQLELDEFAEFNQANIEKNNREIMIENAVIRGIKGERRKIHPMSDAQNRAEDIMEAAGEEIIGMVVEDSREKLDEEKEEREEAAEKIREERQAKEERIEERREENREMEELLEELPLDADFEQEQLQTRIQNEVQSIVERMKLVAEDIKGAAVDMNL